MRSSLALFIAIVAAALAGADAHALTLREAVQHALSTNPAVGGAIAEREATRYELLQAKGRFLPEVELEADIRQQKTDSETEIGTAGNDDWLDGSSISLTARQILFDGWERHYDVYKNAARLDSSALRLLERSQATGLDAVESYIDVARYNEALGLAESNVRRHQDIFNLVRTQFEGGKVPLSDVNQIRSRVSAAEAVVAVMKKALADAEASFRTVIGLEPRGIGPVAWPALMPGSYSEAVTLAAVDNPAIRAALANTDAARHERDENIGSFLPEIAVEGLARESEDINGNPGYDDEYLGKLVLRWKVFDGMIRHNRQRELSERVTAAQMQTDTQRRAVTKAADMAWSALTTGRERLDALQSQVDASEKVVGSFLEEYELTRRTLLEVLDAESLLFNARIQLVGARSIRLFAAHQLLASIGRLLESVGATPPPETVADAQAREQHFINPFDVFLDPLRTE